MLVPGEFPPDYLLPAYSGTYGEDGITIYGTDSGRVFEHDRSTGELSLLAELDAEITAIVASPEFAEDQVVVIGSAFGVGISGDGGSTWDPVGEVGRGITSLALSPDFGDDDTIWAGTTNGLYVTTDLETWNPVDPFDTSAFIEAVAAAPDDDATTLLVSVRGRGLFRSVDSGATFEPVAPELLAQQVVFNSFYHPTTEPIVFSPGFAEDRTVFGLAEDRIYRSTDGGDSWVTIEIPTTLHDPDVDPEAALLSVPRPPEVPDAGSSDGPDRRIETPIGTLTPIRIAFAAILCVGRGRSLVDQAAGAAEPVAGTTESPLVRDGRGGTGGVRGRRGDPGALRQRRSAFEGGVAVSPRERIRGDRHAEEWAQHVVPVPACDVHREQVVAPGEVVGDPGMMFLEQSTPTVRFDLEEDPVVLTRLPCVHDS